MKKVLLLLLILLELFIIKIPEYVELNNLAIIEEIAVEKKDNHYTLILKEVITLKGDQGISYEYEYHQATSSSVSKALTKIKSSTKKKLYLTKTKSLLTNINKTDDIIKTLKIKPKTIIHSQKNIIKEIKDKTT